MSVVFQEFTAFVVTGAALLEEHPNRQIGGWVEDSYASMRTKVSSVPQNPQKKEAGVALFFLGCSRAAIINDTATS